MTLVGNTSQITSPGGFVELELPGLYLRRPISVCDVVGDTLTLIYKVVGVGTDAMCKYESGVKLDVLTGLGNGFDVNAETNAPLLVGGGVGVPPLYMLCKRLIENGKKPSVILGFNTRDDVFFEKEFENGTSVMDIAKSLGAGLFKAACLAKVNGEICDLRTVLTSDCEVEILTFDDEEAKKTFWHTCSHILAQAVKRLYPEVKLAIGPAVEGGFYYDFDSEISFTPEILEKIEADKQTVPKKKLPTTFFVLEGLIVLS